MVELLKNSGIGTLDNLPSLLSDPKAKIIDPENNWVYLNRIWSNPLKRELFYKHYYDFSSPIIRKAQEVYGDKTLILIPQDLTSTYGIMPFGFQLAYDCDAKVAVWDEWGDYLRAMPKLRPSEDLLPSSSKLIVLMDGNERDGRVLRMINASFDPRKAKISAAIVAILDTQKEAQLKADIGVIEAKQNTHIDLHSMLTRSGSKITY